MSTRTKSFFDQNHNAKQHPPQWHRHHNKPALSESNNNIAPPKPPIPASSEAKSKLKAFQFVPGHPDGPHLADNNENTTTPSEVISVDDTEVINNTTRHHSMSQRQGGATASAPPPLPTAATFPSTPGTRLPLEDLIGNYDGNANRPAQENESPEEYLGWIPNSSSALLTPNRKRKRARSSSPSSCANASSQRGDASVSFSAKAGAVDKITPTADPITDLWQHYEAAKQDGDATLPDFSHLLFQASPRALETPARSAGFRRWASTGNEWPTSKTKRRRTNGRTSIHPPPDVPTAGLGEKSRFADMLKKVEDSLATQKIAKDQSKPIVRVEGPSSSSPLPEMGAADAFNDAPAASPLDTKQTGTSTKLHETIQTISPKSAGETFSNDVRRRQSAGAKHTEIRYAPQVDQLISAPLYLQSKAPLPAYKRPAISRTPSNPMQKAQSPAQPIVKAVVNSDEFGDDFDLSVEDLEEITNGRPPLQHKALYDIPPHPNPPPQQDYKDIEQLPAHVRAGDALGSVVQPIQITDFEDDENDEFGMGDIDEATFAEAEICATQAFRISPRKRSKLRSKGSKKFDTLPASQIKSSKESQNESASLLRYVVKQIVEGEYTNEKGRQSAERLLLTEDGRTSKTTVITLRDSWMATSVSVGNVVHVAYLHKGGASDLPPGQIMISNVEGSPLLIVHPDHMLSATTVADSFDCIRKAVLQDRIKATGDTSKSMVYGKILHEIFQQALSANRWDSTFLADLVERTLQNHVESLWELGMVDTVLAAEEINAKMGELASWARIFVAETPSEVALVDDKQGESVWMSIRKLIAIEEHVWSPRYGLKGNIDATVLTTLVDHPKEPGKKLIVPFEVKTGRTTQSPAHRAQTALYTLLLSDRYDVNVAAGILYYLESSAMSRIAPPLNEIRQMVQQRNRLAAYLHRARHPSSDTQAENSEPQTQEIEESGLPGLIENPFKCGRCYAQQSCFAYHGLVESGSADSAGMVDDGKKNHSLVWQEAVGHLQLNAKDQTQADILKQWFTKWDRLLTFEESDLSRLRKELWIMNSTERQAIGRCFGNLVIEKNLTSTAADVASSAIDGIEGSGGRINRFAYSFTWANKQPGASFVQGTQLNVGEPIVVSSEKGQWALANGYVISATKHNITVAVDRKLGNARQRRSDFDEERNQSFVGIMTVGDEDASNAPNEPPMLYRLDKDEFSNGLALVRNNLVTLMSSHPIHTKLRNQVILDARPGFVASSAPPQLAPSQLGEMNEDQQAAVAKVLNAQDYALILGMPGTGKTTTIAHIIRALLAENKSILLASFTHTAVDNILLKICDVAPPDTILRLGVPAKINSEVQKFCQLAATPRKTIDGVEKAYMGSRIVASTCMGTNHALFNRRAFDVCIVDEASQITLPTSLGPLLHARKFVLVGDHYQLPPLVQNRRALEGGLDVSLFRQLSEQHPEALVSLGKQYRMCEDIMSLSNTLIYDGKLRCGNDEVAQRTLKIGDLNALSNFHGTSSTCPTPSNETPCWIEDLVRPARKVAFANTDLADKAAHETLTLGKNITNQFEATLVAQLVLSLLAVGVPQEEIGVITLYRSQLALIRQLFKKAGIGSDVEIDSADRFQGRDKECIILSMVRSNEAGIVGDLLKDWRRVNVALTRARSKLIVLGSRQTLRNNDLLARFLSLVDRRGWSLDLPNEADTCHAFDFSSQAASDLIAQSIASPAKSDGSPEPSKAVSLMGTPQLSISSPRKVLQESPHASNRNMVKAGRSKQPAKAISGRRSPNHSKYRIAMELAAFEIFEDLDAEDF